MSESIPRALELLWHEPSEPARSSGLNRERIVRAAVELADAEGLPALSMARLAERLGCGTMSLYRHVANKDELVIFMSAAAVGRPPTGESTNWAEALTDWAEALWEIYHRHPWVLQAVPAGPPADPGQVAWLDAGLAALADTGLTERGKLAAVMAVLHFVRGAAAVDIEADRFGWSDYPALLRGLLDPERFPALATALREGAFDRADNDPYTDFRSGLSQLLDGIGTRIG